MILDLSLIILAHLQLTFILVASPKLSCRFVMNVYQSLSSHYKHVKAPSSLMFLSSQNFSFVHFITLPYNTLWNHSTVIKRRMFEVLYSYCLFSVEVHVSTLCMPCPRSCPVLNIIFLVCFSLPRKHYQQQDKMDGFLRELQIPKDSPLTPLLSRIPRVRSSLVVVSYSTPCLPHLSHRRYTQPCSTFSHSSFLYTQPHPLCTMSTTS